MPMAPLVTPQNLTTFKALYVLFTSLCDLWREAVRMFETIVSKQQATRTNKSKQQQATPSNNNSNNIIINNNRNGNRTNKLSEKEVEPQNNSPSPRFGAKHDPKLYLVHHHRSVKHVEDVISFWGGEG